MQYESSRRPVPYSPCMTWHDWGWIALLAVNGVGALALAVAVTIAIIES